jgi:TonB family protein
MANLNQSGIFYFQNQGAVAAVRDFPQDLRRNLLSRFEPRFTAIFGGLCLVAFVVVGILSHQKVAETTSAKDIQRIQERYAQLVLNQPKPKVEEVKKEEKAKVRETGTETKGEAKEETKVDRSKETYVEKQKRREATGEERRQRLGAISNQIAKAGIFAAITSSGAGSGPSSDVSDLLGATDVVTGLSGVSVAKGTFATRRIDPADLAGARHGAQTTEIAIQKSSVGTASVQQIAATGSVRLTSEPPKIQGDAAQVQTSQACIQRVVTRESTRIKRVYENWLKRDPQLAGNIKIKFTILPSGSVSNVTVVQSTMNNSEFDQNVVRYIQRWSFADCSPSSPLDIELPFSFSGQS